MSARKLRISPELSLPVDVAGEAIAILAKRGAGKTNTATVLVEELIAAGVQVVIADPVGAWWGLRFGADGKSRGLSIPIIGGQHGDVPLEQTAGALIADVVVDTGESMLLDLSDFPSKAAVARFVTDFAERLYRRKARTPGALHLVLEEADEFAPQKVRDNTARMTGAIEQIVRRGRSRGLGVTLITQRSAVLNKDVLTQTDVLIVMRTTGPQDVKAIKEWIASRADEGAEAVLPSLPSLETGEAWVWNPERGLLDRVRVRVRATFDSSRTPKAGETRLEPREAAPINLETLGAEIAATAERAKENDPAELRKRLREAERKLSQRPTEAPARVETVVERVEVPVVADTQIGQLQETARELRDVAASVGEFADSITREIARATTERRADERGASSQTRTPAARAAAPAARPRVAREERQPIDSGDVQLKAGARRILETLARHHPMRVTRAQLGTLSKFKITGGTFQTYFSQLKRLGLIDEAAGEIALTDAGLDYIGHVPAAPQTTDELLAMWRGALKAGARTMLDELVAAYPDGLTKDELADRVEMTVTGGTFQTYLSTLRRNGLAEINGAYVTASDALFLAGVSS